MAPVLVPRTCENVACGKPFAARATEVAHGRGRHCSRSCASATKGRLTTSRHSQAGAGNFAFKGWRSHHKRAYVDGFRARHPEKAAAHDAVRSALVAGRLVKPLACERCEARPDEPLHSHHEDYSQPLAVTFVCRDCHRILDRARRLRVQSSRNEPAAQVLDGVIEVPSRPTESSDQSHQGFSIGVGNTALVDVKQQSDFVISR